MKRIKYVVYLSLLSTIPSFAAAQVIFNEEFANNKNKWSVFAEPESGNVNAWFLGVVK